MTDEYEEPTNEQLANFMMIYAPRLVGQKNFQLNPVVLERLISEKPEYRASALRHHKQFHKEAEELFKKLEKGQLQCAYIRKNGRKCPNWNEPGGFYCGLHQDEEEDHDGTEVPDELLREREVPEPGSGS